MRILHLSDIHIGVENYGRSATKDDVEALPGHFASDVPRSEYVGVSTRLLDFLSTFDEAVAYALENGVDLVLLAGDAYKSRDPSQTHQREFARRIARLTSNGVPVFLTIGNHDLPHVPNRATALDIFPTLDVTNVTLGSELRTYRVDTPAGPAQIVSLPWIRIGEHMAREETRDLTMGEITRSIEHRLQRRLAEQADALDPALPAFLCGHVTISGAALSSERSMMLGKDHQLPLGAVANPAFDYVALGHIHKHQVLTEHPRVVYPGSLQRVDFSEESDTKGFCVVDIDPALVRGGRVTDFTFVPVDARRMVTIEASAREGSDPTDAALREIERHGDAIAGSIVRVRVEMHAPDERLFRENDVRQALAPAQYIAAIERQVRREQRTRISIEEAESLAPLDALKRYFESRATPHERERALLERAAALLREEEMRTTD